MGGTQMAPGGVMEKAGAVPVSAVMLVCPTCQRATRVGMTTKEVKGETDQGAAVQARRLPRGDRPVMATAQRHTCRASRSSTATP